MLSLTRFLMKIRPVTHKPFAFFNLISLNQIRSFCRTHLEVFASATVGLCIDILASDIVRRVRYVHLNFRILPSLRSKNPKLILKPYGLPEFEIDRFGIYRFPASVRREWNC